MQVGGVVTDQGVERHLHEEFEIEFTEEEQSSTRTRWTVCFPADHVDQRTKVARSLQRIDQLRRALLFETEPVVSDHAQTLPKS